MDVLPTRYYSSLHIIIKERNTNGRVVNLLHEMGNAYKVRLGKEKIRGPLMDLGVDGKVVLKGFLANHVCSSVYCHLRLGLISVNFL
jgi:hypothetical protein